LKGKDEEIGADTLPKGWVSASIGDVADQPVSQEGPSEGNFVYVAIGSVDNSLKAIVEPKTLPLHQAPSRARQRLQVGDVLVSMTRPNLNAVAFVGDHLNNSIGSTGFDVLRSSTVEPKYLFYLVQSHAFVEAMIALVQGALYPAVRPRDIRGHRFALAPLAEQARIVAEIERLFSLLDAGVANLKRVQVNLKRYRASVLQAACTGKLVPTEAELACAEGRDYEPADVLLHRILAERRARWEAEQLAKMRAAGKEPKDDKWKAKYEEPTAPDTSDVHELPNGWIWTTIASGTQCLDHRRVPVNKEERSKRNGAVPYYGANGQVGWIDDYLFDEPLVLVVEDETFIGREKPFSYKIKGKTWVNNHAHILRAVGGLNLDFLNYSLAYYPFIPLTQGTTGRRKLTKEALMNAPFQLPPIAEQERIVAEIERRLSVVDALETTVKQNLKRAELLRQAILRDAFAGKLVPQDPSDEPASLLLARIEAERAASTATGAKVARTPKNRTCKEGQPDGRHDPNDPAGESVPPRMSRRKQDTGERAQVQPELFSSDGA
jgi:type I restriction enzyme S subunit